MQSISEHQAYHIRQIEGIPLRIQPHADDCSGYAS